MLNDAFIIFKKELRNLLKDRRTLFSTFILPLVMLPIIFIGMGAVVKSIEDSARETTYKIEIVDNKDNLFKESLSEYLLWEEVDDQVSDFKIIFPPKYAPGSSANVIISYDSSSRKNQLAVNMVSQALTSYELEIAQNVLSLYNLTYQDLHTINIVLSDTAQEAAQAGGSILAMLMPYFMVIFLFSGSMNAGLDTTSGEKERGSLAVLLVNQVSRSSIAWGKIIYVSVVSLFSAIATFIGLLIAIGLPGGSDSLLAGGLLEVGFDPISLLIIILALISSALVSAALITVIGCLAKSVKEGSSYVMPLYMVVVIIGVTTMYMDPSKNTLLFVVPIVNTIFVLKESFMGMYAISHVVLTLTSNLILAVLQAMAVSKLFNSERILQTV
ncbi:MAG: ABC transporter permease subunit [Sphaerochaetaceae bacterium]|jgi:sodium transport system permease protein